MDATEKKRAWIVLEEDTKSVEMGGSVRQIAGIVAIAAEWLMSKGLDVIGMLQETMKNEYITESVSRPIGKKEEKHGTKTN